jgi:hypothetical protein
MIFAAGIHPQLCGIGHSRLKIGGTRADEAYTVAA